MTCSGFGWTLVQRGQTEVSVRDYASKHFLRFYGSRILWNSFLPSATRMFEDHNVESKRLIFAEQVETEGWCHITLISGNLTSKTNFHLLLAKHTILYKLHEFDFQLPNYCYDFLMVLEKTMPYNCDFRKDYASVCKLGMCPGLEKKKRTSILMPLDQYVAFRRLQTKTALFPFALVLSCFKCQNRKNTTNNVL